MVVLTSRCPRSSCTRANVVAVLERWVAKEWRKLRQVARFAIPPRVNSCACTPGACRKGAAMRKSDNNGMTRLACGVEDLDDVHMAVLQPSDATSCLAESRSTDDLPRLGLIAMLTVHVGHRDVR